MPGNRTRTLSLNRRWPMDRLALVFPLSRFGQPPQSDRTTAKSRIPKGGYCIGLALFRRGLVGPVLAHFSQRKFVLQQASRLGLSTVETSAQAEAKPRFRLSMFPPARKSDCRTRGETRPGEKCFRQPRYSMRFDDFLIYDETATAIFLNGIAADRIHRHLDPLMGKVR